METTTLRERVESTIRNGPLRCTDFGSYDWSWLDGPTDQDEVRWQLQWLREAAEECEADGYEEDAEAYADLHDIIQEELALVPASLVPAKLGGRSDE